MALNSGTLTSAMKSATEAALQAQFSGIVAELRPADQTRIGTLWSKLAQAIADGDAPVTVSHFVSNADVLVASHSGPALFDPQGAQIIIDNGPALGSTGHVTQDQDIQGMGSIQ